MYSRERFAALGSIVMGSVDAVFEILDLHFSYPVGGFGLSNIDLTVCRGERLALLGPNGAGKTTLIRLLAGLLPDEKNAITYRGKNSREKGRVGPQTDVGIMFQDPDDHLFCNTVLEDVAFGPLTLLDDRMEAQNRAMSALDDVGLKEMANLPPHCLSFGQRKRVAFAAIMAMLPEVLILDEPTANLDVNEKRRLLDCLGKFQGTLILVSHDLKVVNELCDRFVEMESGQIVPKKGGPLPAQSQPVLLQRESQCGSPILELQGYSFKHPGSLFELEDINISCLVGEAIAVVGDNGAGKSTLARCLLGDIGGSGSYFFKGYQMSGRERRRLWRHIGMVFQDTADQLFCASCLDEVAFGPLRLGETKREAHKISRQVLADVGLEGYEQVVPLHLSGGERRRLAVASVLSMRPEVLILDEPSANLDGASCNMLIQLLNNLKMTKVIISHDPRLLRQCCTREIMMESGRIIENDKKTI